MEKNDKNSERKLARVLGFWPLFLYGVGDILGAGIYALFGKVVEFGKSESWIAFALAVATALLTALSYAELSARFPRSGGAASFVLEGLKNSLLSLVVGWMVLWSGIVSMATISQAFALQSSIWISIIPVQSIIVGFLVILGIINFWGMYYTSLVNILCTFIEFSGIVIVIYAAVGFIFSTHTAALPNFVSVSWTNILQAAGIAFFALTGFEDMVNVAEEVKNPKKNLPRAILSAVGFAGIAYTTIAYTTVKVISPDSLASAKNPLLNVVEKGLPEFPLFVFAFIALFAMANTALLNFVMGSRLMYGMAQEGLIPAFFGRVHLLRKTPYVAIIVLFCVVVSLSVTIDLKVLAATTSAILLIVFSLVHIALLFLKMRKIPHKGFTIFWFFPIFGVISNISLLYFLPLESKFGAISIAACGWIFLFFYRYTSKKQR